MKQEYLELVGQVKEYITTHYKPTTMVECEHSPAQRNSDLPTAKSESSKMNSRSIEPEKLEPKNIELVDIRKILEEQMPHMKILDFVPDDRVAIGSTRQSIVHNAPQVALLSFSTHLKINIFLNQIARSITLRFGLVSQVLQAKEWEAEQKWDILLESSQTRLIVGSDYGMQMLPQLMKHYRETSKNGQHFLKDKLLLLLPDMTLYMREPHLKASLWQTFLAHLN